MRSNTARIAIAVGAIAVIVVLFVVLNGGDDGDDNKASTSSTTTSSQPSTSPTDKAKPPAPKVPVVEVREGKPVGGIEKLTYTKGDQVRFRVRSDVADEIHVHGYDVKKDVPAGGSVSFSFPGKFEGVFEIELEGRQEQIAQLTVRPA
jgi:hypothetical protein